MALLAGVMALNLFARPFVVGAAALVIVAAVTGVHSLMSGTAAADFGGRKATATCSGVVDGFVYLGSGVQSLGVGYLVTHWRIWHALPAATRKYIDEVERQGRTPVAQPAMVAD